MSAGDDISGVALAVALVALTIAILQAIQQYFSTAEGFRYCREDVIGGWSKLRDYRLDVSLARFETQFVAPHFMLVQPQMFYRKRSDRIFQDRTFLQRQKDKLLRRKRSEEDKRNLSDLVWPIGDPGLPDGTSKRSDMPSARVSWLTLLEHIKDYQEALYEKAFEHKPEIAKNMSDAEEGSRNDKQLWLSKWFHHLVDDPKKQEGKQVIEEKDQNEGSSDLTGLLMPAATKTLVSWDFMPPDVRKPIATVTLHDLLVLGYRLGLDWTDVNPRGERLTAQDDFGYDISASRIMGLGLVVQFQYSAKQNPLELSWPDSDAPAHEFVHPLTVPHFQADKLAFGVIPGDPRLGFDDVVLSSRRDCMEFLKTLGNNPPGVNFQKALEQNLNSHPYRSGIEQLMPLISPCLLIDGCKTATVRSPNEWTQRGVLWLMEGYVIYRNTIQEWKVKDSTPKSCREIIEWIQTGWVELRDTLRKPFVWVAFIDQTDPATRARCTAKVHGECTSKLEEMTEAFIEKLNEGLKRSYESKSEKGEKGGPQEYLPISRSDRRPMKAMLRFHMRRAIMLHDRMLKLPEKDKVQIPGDVQFPEAPIWCNMMAIMMKDMDELAREVIRNVVTAKEASDLEKEQAEIFAKLIEILGNIWLVWIFRALVFNRSCTFGTPRRSGGGKQYSLIPAEWLNSNLPVHIT